MKKNTVKAFTLVEMLIVIVIIGILIAALLPRMQGAQGRARDVSRQTNLSQISTAIISSQADKRQWPKQKVTTGNKAADGISVNDIKDELLKAGMSDVPADPNGVNSVYGLGGAKEQGSYIYMVSKKNGADEAGFILMASTETEGASNWVVCSENGSGHIATGTDISTIKVCPSIEQDETCENPNDGTSTCKYKDNEQLRYIYTY